MAENVTGSTLFVGNLPYTTTKSELEKLFSDIGPVKRCFVVPDKGFGYVTFALREDAQSAIENVKKFSGRKLNLKFAKPKSEQVSKEEQNEEKEKSDGDAALIHRSTNKDKKNASKKKPPAVKKGRLIIRNLPFKATVTDIRKEFDKYGNIVEVVIPRKNDGKMFGFGFVQYDKVANAASAIKAMNAQAILGRHIAVDWSIPKKRYVELTQQKDETDESDSKKCVIENNDVISNDSSSDSATDDSNNPRNSGKNVSHTKTVQRKKKDDHAAIKNKSITKVSHSDEYQDDIEDLVDDSSDDDDSASDSERTDNHDNSVTSDSNSEDEDESSKDSEMEEDHKKTQKYRKNKEKQKHHQSDVIEGKTLFIRNISFNTTQEKLHDTFLEFGPLHYAMICIDPLTEHSKGTGFVKFRTKEDADKCLAQVDKTSKDEGLILDGQKLQVSLAISREELQKRAEEKKKTTKDNRNLYLAREGLIRPGTGAAEGVSKQDMTKRTELEIWKRRMLRNLHIFISRTRLCVRNLPPSINEQKLKKIFLKAAGPEATIKEIKILRNLKKVSSDGLGESKGFGFIGFTKHEHALQALRNTNNNPLVFTATMRPIVEFSLENLALLKAKEKRLEMSRQKNVAERNRKEKMKSGSKSLTDGDTALKDSTKHSCKVYESFVGTKVDTDTSAITKTLPSHLGPKIRHNRKTATKLSRRNFQKQKLKYRERKRKLKSLKKAANKNSMPPPVKKKQASKSEAKLDSLVNNYKRKLESKEHRIKKKKKWFHNS